MMSAVSTDNEKVCAARAQAMAAQGSGGAYEISQRMTAMVGWGATAGFAEDWTWDQAADTYALDPAMADTLRRNNPEVRAHSVLAWVGLVTYCWVLRSSPLPHCHGFQRW